MKKTISKSLALATVSALCFAGSAFATPILTVTDGIATIQLADLDADGVEVIGVGGFFGPSPFANFAVSVNTGVTKPLIGSAELPRLDLNSVNVSSTGAGTLTIEWFADNFYPSASLINSAKTFIGGTTDGSVSFASYYSLDNKNDSSMQLLSDMTFPTVGGAFSGTEFADWSDFQNNPIAYKIVATVTHTNSGQISSFDGALDVPEPGALLAFGTGMMGLIGIAVRRKED